MGDGHIGVSDERDRVGGSRPGGPRSHPLTPADSSQGPVPSALPGDAARETTIYPYTSPVPEVPTALSMTAGAAVLLCLTAPPPGLAGCGPGRGADCGHRRRKGNRRSIGCLVPGRGTPGHRWRRSTPSPASPPPTTCCSAWIRAGPSSPKAPSVAVAAFRAHAGARPATCALMMAGLSALALRRRGRSATGNADER